MSHKRTEIRSALLGVLKGTTAPFPTSADNRVYKNRVHNLETAKLPAIVIRDEPESSTPLSIQASQYIRKLTMKIEIRVEANEDYDDELDALCDEVEELLQQNKKLGGLATGMVLVSTEPSFEAAAKVIGLTTLTYEITYIY